jgi:hypothetical protein
MRDCSVNPSIMIYCALFRNAYVSAVKISGGCLRCK